MTAVSPSNPQHQDLPNQASGGHGGSRDLEGMIILVLEFQRTVELGNKNRQNKSQLDFKSQITNYRFFM